MENKFYQLLKNYLSLFTFGLFLSLFAFYLRTPFDREAKVKDTCAKLNSSYQITGAEAMKKLNLNKINNYNNRELANYYCERYLGIKQKKETCILNLKNGYHLTEFYEVVN